MQGPKLGQEAMGVSHFSAVLSPARASHILLGGTPAGGAPGHLPNKGKPQGLGMPDGEWYLGGCQWLLSTPVWDRWGPKGDQLEGLGKGRPMSSHDELRPLGWNVGIGQTPRSSGADKKMKEAAGCVLCELGRPCYV